MHTRFTDALVSIKLPNHRRYSVVLAVPAESLRDWDTETKQNVVEPGDYQFLVGAASDNLQLKLAMAVAAR